MLGRAAAPNAHRGTGYDHFEVVVDDPDESGASAAAALVTALEAFADEGITVERVMTDNGWAYRSATYRAVLGHRPHTRTGPYRPQTNGKAERFIGTLLTE